MLPGFPWTGKFTTKEEIENYFADEDKIQCLLCGKWFKKLGPHLQVIHEITQNEYRAEFGLPWSHGLACKNLSNHFSKIMTKRIKNGFDPTPDDAARKKSKTAIRRKDQPFFTNLKAEQAKKINNARNKFTHQDFEKVLARMLEKQKTLDELGNEKDLPGLTAVYEYSKLNPQFRQELLDTYHALPYCVQARAKMLSKQFNHDAKRLRQQGLLLREIGSELGVSTRTVIRHLKKTEPKITK